MKIINLQRTGQDRIVVTTEGFKITANVATSFYTSTRKKSVQ